MGEATVCYYGNLSVIQIECVARKTFLDPLVRKNSTGRARLLGGTESMALLCRQGLGLKSIWFFQQLWCFPIHPSGKICWIISLVCLPINIYWLERSSFYSAYQFLIKWLSAQHRQNKLFNYELSTTKKNDKKAESISQNVFIKLQVLFMNIWFILIKLVCIFRNGKQQC